MVATTPNLAGQDSLPELGSRYLDIDALPWEKGKWEGIERKTLMEDTERGIRELLGIGLHDGVKGKSKEPYRVMINLGVNDIHGEHAALSAKGVQFIRPIQRDGCNRVLYVNQNVLVVHAFSLWDRD